MERKPQTAADYDPALTDYCERALVTLLGGLGTLKPSLRLIGGLVPRYLAPPGDGVPVHAGTRDVDIVLNLQVLAKGESYAALGRQLKKLGFERGFSDDGVRVSWRWQLKIETLPALIVDFLCDRDDPDARRVGDVDGEEMSACVIDHCGIVHEWYLERQVTAPLFYDKGVTTEIVRYADLPSFIILKALAIDERRENKDVGDLMYVLRYAGPLEQSAQLFHDRRATGRHPELFEKVINILRRRFCDGEGVSGFERDGPVAYANFLYRDDAENEEPRTNARRYAAGAVMEFLRHLDRLHERQLNSRARRTL